MKLAHNIAVYLILLTIFILNSCKNSKPDTIAIDFYACPRNFSCSFSFDVGIFRYELKKQNITMQKSDCCFLYKTENDVKDSVIELAYKNLQISKELFDTLFQAEHFENNSVFQHSPRALFLVKKEPKQIDTIFLDKNLTVRYKNKTFKSNKRLELFLYNNLPLELNENWVENYQYQIRFNNEK